MAGFIDRRGCKGRQKGISTIEIALILLIIALTISAVFKGQEMVFAARTKSLMAQTEQARVAFLGFQDRFRAVPGDYRDAPANISGVTYHGDGNGKIDVAVAPIGPNAVAYEDEIVWNHLSKAGFYAGSFDYQAGNPLSAMPRNAFGGWIGLSFSNRYGSPAGPGQPSRHTINTGNQIPVQYLSEMDLKMDDGNALHGSFQFSNYVFFGSGAPVGPPLATGCSDAAGNWRTGSSNPPTNCGARP